MVGHAASTLVSGPCCSTLCRKALWRRSRRARSRSARDFVTWSALWRVSLCANSSCGLVFTRPCSPVMNATRWVKQRSCSTEETQHLFVFCYKSVVFLLWFWQFCGVRALHNSLWCVFWWIIRWDFLSKTKGYFFCIWLPHWSAHDWHLPADTHWTNLFCCQVDMVEAHIQMTPAMVACQHALLDLIHACIKELKKFNTSVSFCSILCSFIMCLVSHGILMKTQHTECRVCERDREARSWLKIWTEVEAEQQFLKEVIKLLCSFSNVGNVILVHTVGHTDGSKLVTNQICARHSACTFPVLCHLRLRPVTQMQCNSRGDHLMQARPRRWQAPLLQMLLLICKLFSVGHRRDDSGERHHAQLWQDRQAAPGSRVASALSENQTAHLRREDTETDARVSSWGKDSKVGRPPLLNWIMSECQQPPVPPSPKSRYPLKKKNHSFWQFVVFEAHYSSLKRASNPVIVSKIANFSQSSFSQCRILEMLFFYRLNAFSLEVQETAVWQVCAVFRHLTQYDCVSFYSLVNSIRSVPGIDGCVQVPQLW